MHKRKIDMADEIFVINVNGYIGESTKSEIEYAKKAGKAVNYLENQKTMLFKSSKSPTPGTPSKKEMLKVNKFIGRVIPV